MKKHGNEVPGAEASEMRPEAVGANDAVTGDAITGAITGAASGDLDAAQWAELLAAYRVGETAPMLARRFGVSAPRIYLRVGSNGKRARSRTRTQAAGGHHQMQTLVRSMTDALATLGSGLMLLGRQALTASGVSEQASVRGDGKLAIRRHLSPAVWLAARRDYEEGDFTAGEIGNRYGVAEKTVANRAARDQWSKTVKVAPPPLLPPDDPAQVDALGDSAWAVIAHEAQRPPEGAWSTWLFQGGRGAGKTRAGAEWLAARAEATPNGRFALVAPTEHDLREVMIEGASGLRALPGREHPKYHSSRRMLRWNNGAVAYGFSAEQPERLRGPQFMAAWADEFCTWKKPLDVLSNLRLGLRLGDDPRLVVTTTPKPISALRKLRAEVSCVMTQAATVVNAANLAGSFLQGIEALYGGTRLAEQELNGVLVDGDGALWKAEEIARGRAERPGKLDRVVVAIDPPAGLEGSACGIIVAGRRGKHGYVLADRTVMGVRPLAWAQVAADAAREFGAVRIVAEGNQGGEMVRETLMSADVPCAVDLVRAVRSKRARAEPISVLYERGLIHHCGSFPALEEELMAMGAGENEVKSDRADALVWAITALKLTSNVAALPSIEQL
jgi:phage terminase large subunit-like protein